MKIIKKNKYTLVTLLILCILILLYYLLNQSKPIEPFKVLKKIHLNKKQNVNKKIKIPLKIWQTHKTNDLPESSYNNIKKLINMNPEFSYHFFTNEDMDRYMKENFSPEVNKAYNKINPGAGKADIWRLGVIMKEGGLYIDVDKILKDDSKPFIDIIDEQDEFIQGIGWHIWGNKAPSTNATLCAVPNHPVIKMTFDSVIDSILNDNPLTQIGEYKGWAKLENYTGTPHLWKSISHYINSIDMKQGQFTHGIVISNKLEENLKQNEKYGDDLKEMDAKHWSSQPVFKEQFNNKYNYKNTIIQTYYDKSKIPKKVYDNIKKYAKNYKHIIFDDNECIEFLQNNFTKDIVNRFKTLQLGAHKADLFRYCYLYINGGLYLDIKTVLIKPIEEIFKDKTKFYSVFSYAPGTVYQGILFAPPKMKLFLILIKKVLKTSDKQLKEYRTILTKQFYDTVKELTKQEKLNLGLNDNMYYFFQERNLNKIHCNNKLGRWGGCYFVFDNEEKIIKIRYEDFPW